MRIKTRLRGAARRLQHLLRNALNLCLRFYLATACDGSLVEAMRARTPEPEAGLRDYQGRLVVGVPGGLANIAGGNLYLRAPGLTLATALGAETVEPVYTSPPASGASASPR